MFLKRAKELFKSTPLSLRNYHFSLFIFFCDYVTFSFMVIILTSGKIDSNFLPYMVNNDDAIKYNYEYSM